MISPFTKSLIVVYGDMVSVVAISDFLKPPALPHVTLTGMLILMWCLWHQICGWVGSSGGCVAARVVRP